MHVALRVGSEGVQILPNTPKIGNGPVLLIRLGCSIRFERG